MGGGGKSAQAQPSGYGNLNNYQDGLDFNQMTA
jgi:hypothetical protein